jgi:SAM-dependent methyltransferase
MYKELTEISSRPAPFSVYTAEKLWNDPHISKQMLKHHLDPEGDIASRNKKHIEQSVAWISDTFTIDQNSSIADFGCGPGLYTLEFARRGAHLTGIDFSERSIEYAKEQTGIHKLNIEYFYSNYLDYTTDRKFDVILLLYYDFCPLSPEQRKQLLSVFYKCLKDNGSILFDVLSFNAFDNKQETSLFRRNLMDGFWSEQDYFGFEHCFKYENIKVALDKYSIIDKTGLWHVYNWFQYYSLETLGKELSENSFEITGRYSDATGQAYDRETEGFMVTARKIS